MVIQQAVEVLKLEAQGILKLIDRIDKNFTEMVELICRSKGRLIVGGIGKSGIVGRKIVATLNSTGTRSIFLHPVEAMHGDLGMVSHEDVFLALSNSGETDELNILIPSIKNVGCKVIAFTGNTDSTLAKNSDIIIDVGVDKEACPLGLAPTSSTTALLAMGDALAVVLINKKHFQTSDFKKIHPGGASDPGGRRLPGVRIRKTSRRYTLPAGKGNRPGDICVFHSPRESPYPGFDREQRTSAREQLQRWSERNTR